MWLIQSKVTRANRRHVGLQMAYIFCVIWPLLWTTTCKKKKMSEWKPPPMIHFLVHFIKEPSLNAFRLSQHRETFQLEPPPLTFALNTYMRAQGWGMCATLANWANIWGFWLLLTWPGALEPRRSFCLAGLRCRKSESADKDTSPAVRLTNNDRQLTHSSENWGLAVSMGQDVWPRPWLTESWLLML